MRDRPQPGLAGGGDRSRSLLNPLRSRWRTRATRRRGGPRRSRCGRRNRHRPRRQRGRLWESDHQRAPDTAHRQRRRERSGRWPRHDSHGEERRHEQHRERDGGPLPIQYATSDNGMFQLWTHGREEAGREARHRVLQRRRQRSGGTLRLHDRGDLLVEAPPWMGERERRAREQLRLVAGGGEEVPPEVLHGAVPVGGMTRERSVDHVGERAGDALRDGVEARRRLGADLEEAGEMVAVGTEGRPAREHLVQGRAHRPDVGARVDGCRAVDLLGCHVGGRSHEGTRGGAPRPRTERLARRKLPRDGPGVVAVEHVGDAKIDELRHDGPRVAPRKEDVRRVEVAVDDPNLVEAYERAHHRDHQSQRIGHVERARPVEERGEVLPAHALFNQVQRARAVVAPHADDAHDVGVIEHREGLRLAERPLLGGALSSQVGVEHLHRHALIGPQVAPFEQHTHAAIRDHRDELVGLADDVAGSDVDRRRVDALVAALVAQCQRGARRRPPPPSPRGAHEAATTPYWRRDVGHR